MGGKQRRKEEKELADKKARIERAREARAKAAAEGPPPMPDMGGMPGGMGGMGGLFSDPELLESLSDPEVAAAFEDITSNPANIMKYQGNPKVKTFNQNGWKNGRWRWRCPRRYGRSWGYVRRNGRRYARRYGWYAWRYGRYARRYG